MEEFEKLRRLRIKKDEISIYLLERKEVKTKSLIFLSLFVLGIVLMGLLETVYAKSQITEIELKAGKGVLKLAGMFFWIGLFLLIRVFSVNKEIKTLVKEYDEFSKEIQYLSN